MKKELPSGWQKFTLEEILSKEKYSIKRGPFGSDLKKDFFVKDGIKVFEQYNPINNDPHWCRYRITKEKYNQLSAFKCKAGDFLISCSGTLGKIILLPNNVEEGIINQALLKIRLNNDIVDNIYFLNLFQSKVFQNKIYGDARGGAIKNVASIDEIKKIEFILPPLDEQKRIADILSTFDDLIENLTKLIEKKELYKKGVMQRVLTGKVRFNGFTDEWETVRLGDICEYFRGLSYNKQNVVDFGLLVLRSNNIQNYKIDLSDDELQFVNKNCNDDILLKKHDIVICMANGTKKLVGKSAEYKGNYKGKITIGAFCGLLRTKNVLLKYILQTKLYRDYIDIILAGTNINNLRSSELLDFTFQMPPSIEEQKKIGELLSLIDKDIDNLKKMLQLRKLQKKGVMQKLLTGEVRV